MPEKAAKAKKEKPVKEKPVKVKKNRKKFGINLFTNLMSAPKICVLYPLAALILFVIYHTLIPPVVKTLAEDRNLLPIFKMKTAFSSALLMWIDFFPALIFSALVMPFGLKPDFETPEKRFSPAFFNRLKPYIFSALASAAIFAVLILMVRPSLYNYRQQARVKSMIYKNAIEKAADYAKRDDWAMAVGFFAVGKKIWAQDPSTAELEQNILTGREMLVLKKPEREGISGIAQPPDTKIEGKSKNERKPVNAATALDLAVKALEEKRYNDANYLAELASNLAKPGSAIKSSAERVSQTAWRSISRMEMTADEERLNLMYHQKQTGYDALVAEDYLRSYYIFHELLFQIPDDPDVVKYHDVSRDGVLSIAFFIDEMEKSAGGEIEGAIFSLPRNTGGRMVVKADYLTTMENESYASRLEIAAFDGNNKPAFRVETPFAKIKPVNINGEERSLVLLRAVDRNSERVRWDPLWIEAENAGANTGGESGVPGGFQLILDINYGDFLLTAMPAGSESLRSYYIGDFWNAAEALEAYGYAPEVFYAEILNLLGDALNFLPLAIFTILIGWRFRSRHRPPFAGLPMAVILPLVFNGLWSLASSNLKNIYIMLILCAGFTAALALSIAFAALLFLISMIILAFQHG
ncbi:MAG: hypothetical protein LBG72_01630 [Spirochaetaceae bacterium]|jgi:hypothetical protein|nr:hypothetical protein [Spirochaetaceae bacterium]